MRNEEFTYLPEGNHKGHDDLEILASFFVAVAPYKNDVMALDLFRIDPFDFHKSR